MLHGMCTQKNTYLKHPFQILVVCRIDGFNVMVCNLDTKNVFVERSSEMGI